MIALGPLLIVSAFLTQSPTTDSLRLRARTLPDSALAEEVKTHSVDVRDAVTEALARSVRASPGARDAELATASRLARTYAETWGDSFLVRQVERFVAASPERRVAKLATDSIRRVGVATYATRGPRAAIAVWRRALARSEAIDDSVGAAAALGNVGAAYARLSLFDSATVYLGRAAALATTVGDLRVQANALAEIAGVREAADDIAGARVEYGRALALRQRIGDTRGLAADYNNLGLLAERVGDLSVARAQFDAALTLNRRDGRDDAAATNLVNIAGLESRAGNFARASAFYREALATWRNSERWPDAADALRGLGQLELRRGDYTKARTELSEAITAYNRAGLVNDAIAARQDLAAALAASGQLQGAVDELRRAQRAADSISVALDARAGLALARADLAAQLNAYGEADRLYASALTLYRKASDRAGEAEAQHGRGIVLLAQGDRTRARELLAAALVTQQAIGNQRGASLTRMSLAELSFDEGDTTGARRQFARAAAELDHLGDPIGTAAALGERAAMEATIRMPATAESLFAAALAKVGVRPAPNVTWQLHAGLGTVRQREGALDDAGRELRASISDIEHAQMTLAAPERRSAFLADKADVYLQLALLERARGRTGAAFELSERTRAREMLELLSQGRIATPAVSGEVVEREQDLRRRIGELTREVEVSTPSTQPLRGPEASSASAVAREALSRAQHDYGDLLVEMRERVPTHAALVSPEGANVRDVARNLSPEDAFIEYLVSDTASLAFLITRDTVAVANLEIGRHALAKLIDYVRGTLRPRGNPRLDSLWRAPLRELHARLILPLEESGLLKGKTRLILVPQAELNYLPFAALVDGLTQKFLVERYEIVMTPSASVWLALAARVARRPGAGVLALAPNPAALPASRAEVAAIARLGGADVRVLVGKEATEDAFRREASSRRVLHLATFGYLNRQNPLFSFVDLAPGGAEDGRLEVHEVFGLALSADLVVLSACQTALGSGALSDLPAGDDWVGLARAFLHAGAARVMASLWAVDDRATAVLMERFYRAYVGKTSAASALAVAQRALIDAGSTSHPFYWAGFQIVGEQ